MTQLLAAALVAYVVLTYALALRSRRRIRSAEDFLVAGRRLPLGLAAATLLATWFGAGTMLTAADAIHGGGLRLAALEPIGAGLCLLLAGTFLAERLWSLRLLTVADLFRVRFGPRAELLCAALTVPTFLGWIAVQFVALAGILALFFGVDPQLGIPLVAAVATGYTLLGGMWSVALTDALQLVILLVGLVILAVAVVGDLGGGAVGAGLAKIAAEAPAGHLQLVPTERLGELIDWLGVLAIAALGNLSGQDLLSRIFAAQSARIARRACQIAGVAYLVFGAIPVLLGLAAAVILGPGESTAVLPRLAALSLSPALAVVFTLALASAVFSTVDSALLAPAGVLAQNLLGPRLPGRSALALNRLCVVLVAIAALALALVGTGAYGLLEDAYALGLVALFVPLVLGLGRRPRREASAIAAMLVGTGVWAAHVALGWDDLGGPASALPLPRELAGASLAFVAFVVAERLGPRPREAPAGAAQGGVDTRR